MHVHLNIRQIDRNGRGGVGGIEAEKLEENERQEIAMPRWPKAGNSRQVQKIE